MQANRADKSIGSPTRLAVRAEGDLGAKTRKTTGRVACHLRAYCAGGDLARARSNRGSRARIRHKSRLR